MFSTAMKLNERNVSSFASSDSPVDKEGYLSRKNEVKGFQRRWFVLKGNLLFSYEKKQDKEPSGLIILESCSVQASATEKHGFEISFDGPGTRTYVLVADNDEEMQAWMRVVSHASYEFLRSIVLELQKQVNSLTSQTQSKEQPPVKKSTDGKIPILPKAKVKVEDGILVDVDEIPPVPPKKRLSTKQSLSPDPEPTSPLSQEGSESSYPINPYKPHSSPVIVPSIRGASSLSPPGTLDRTPVMVPTIIEDDDYDVPPSPVPLPTETTRPFINMPSTHSPSVVRSMAAPPTTHQNVLDVHQGFSEALHMLQSERVTQSIDS